VASVRDMSVSAVRVVNVRNRQSSSGIGLSAVPSTEPGWNPACRCRINPATIRRGVSRWLDAPRTSELVQSGFCDGGCRKKARYRHPGDGDGEGAGRASGSGEQSSDADVGLCPLEGARCGASLRRSCRDVAIAMRVVVEQMAEARGSGRGSVRHPREARLSVALHVEIAGRNDHAVAAVRL
jgi:hypothetical protein